MADDRGGISRRTFLTGVGAMGAAGAVMPHMLAEVAQAADDNHAEVHRGDIKLVLRINGEARTVQVEPRTTLANALRNHLDMTGTKLVCDRGECGACTVLLDGKSIYSCMLLAVDAVGHSITTVEGLHDTPLQQAFVKHDAMMCGFCTPGFVMALTGNLAQTERPTLEQVRAACSGNLCRCGTYPRIFEAALEAGGGHHAG